MQPRFCRGLHLSPSGHWEPVSKVLQLLCVMSELASIQSFYHTGSLKMLLLLPVQDWQVSGYT